MKIVLVQNSICKDFVSSNFFMLAKRLLTLACPNSACAHKNMGAHTFNHTVFSGEGNLGRHLSNRHPGYDKATGDAVTNPAPLPTIVIKKNQPQAKMPLVDLDHLNWLLIKWFIVASLPPSALEKWLANSFKFLNSTLSRREGPSCAP